MYLGPFILVHLTEDESEGKKKEEAWCEESNGNKRTAETKRVREKIRHE